MTSLPRFGIIRAIKDALESADSPGRSRSLADAKESPARMLAIRRNALSAMRMPIESLDLRSRDWHLARANPVSRTRAERQQGPKERFQRMKRVKTAKVRGGDARAAAQAELMSCAAGIVA